MRTLKDLEKKEAASTSSSSAARQKSPVNPIEKDKRIRRKRKAQPKRQSPIVVHW